MTPLVCTLEFRYGEYIRYGRRKTATERASEMLVFLGKRGKENGTDSAKLRSTPTPWTRVCETKSKKGRSRHRKSFMHRAYSSRRGIETVVSDNVSEGARLWDRGRFEVAKYWQWFADILHAVLKEFSNFCCGVTPPNPSPTPSPWRLAFLHQEDVSKRGGFGEEKLPGGRVGWTGRNRNKGCAKKMGLLTKYHRNPRIYFPVGTSATSF